MPNVIIVNEKDEIICHKPRSERLPSEIGRVAGLIVLNLKGETLIAQRSHNKIKDPGKWGPSVAGTVEEGETYISNIIKEAKEEIDLDITENDLKVETHSYQETSHKYFSTMFSAVVDKPISGFKKQDNEVVEIRWIKITDLVEWFEKNPADFIPSFQKTVNILKTK